MGFFWGSEERGKDFLHISTSQELFMTNQWTRLSQRRPHSSVKALLTKVKIRQTGELLVRVKTEQALTQLQVRLFTNIMTTNSRCVCYCHQQPPFLPEQMGLTAAANVSSVTAEIEQTAVKTSSSWEAAEQRHDGNICALVSAINTTDVTLAEHRWPIAGQKRKIQNSQKSNLQQIKNLILSIHSPAALLLHMFYLGHRLRL